MQQTKKRILLSIRLIIYTFKKILGLHFLDICFWCYWQIFTFKSLSSGYLELQLLKLNIKCRLLNLKQLIQISTWLNLRYLKHSQFTETDISQKTISTKKKKKKNCRITANSVLLPLYVQEYESSIPGTLMVRNWKIKVAERGT